MATNGKRQLVNVVLAAAIVIAAAADGCLFAYRHSVKLDSGTPSGLSIDEPLHPKQIVVTSTPDATIPRISNGLAPVISHLPTQEKVVFLGIDDGRTKLNEDIGLMYRNHIVASLFLTNDAIKDNPDYFKAFITHGSLVEDHTLTHPLLSKLSYAEQKKEICGEADKQLEQFGRRPILFRPPGGDYNEDTRRAAADCGMQAVVQWIAKANGGSMQYQVGKGLQPGDIVLMHFRPEFKADINAFIEAEQAAGLHTELLENWLPAS